MNVIRSTGTDPPTPITYPSNSYSNSFAIYLNHSRNCRNSTAAEETVSPATRTALEWKRQVWSTFSKNWYKSAMCSSSWAMYSNSFTGYKTISLLQECCDFTIKKEELLGQHQQRTFRMNNSRGYEKSRLWNHFWTHKTRKSFVFGSWRVLHSPHHSSVYTIQQYI